MTLRKARLLQLLGLLIAIVGLVGYWFTRDVKRAEYTPEQLEVLGVKGDEKPLTFILAGRDIAYTQVAGDPVYDANGHMIGRKYDAKSNVYGTNTDTIFYVSIINNEITLVSIPRDIWLDDWQTKINSIYYYKKAEGLKNSVAQILDLPIDYYVIINLDIFKNLVDALDGVEVNVPYRMFYQDFAANLFIDLDPGLQTLDGTQAADFVRYRHTARGDYDRIDRIKTLAYAMLERIKALNVRATGKVPELVQTLFKDVETNISLPLVMQLLPKLNDIKIKSSVIIPTEAVEIQTRDGTTQALTINRKDVEAVVAETFDGKARDFAEAPDTKLLITNRSGEAELAKFYKERLVAMGIPEANIVTKEAELDPTPTRMLATLPYWQDADYYASLFQTGKQQIDHIDAVDGQKIGLELLLGEDAARTALSQSRKLTSQASKER